jgi:hypothetical protein
VTRDRHPAAFSSPKAVRRSRDRGCNGHRILRRALTDGRHPGSLRGVSRHGRAFRVVLAGPCILRPIINPSKEGVAVTKQHTRRRVRRGDEQGFATGVSEVRSPTVPWEQDAHAHDSKHRFEVGDVLMTIRRSGLGRRETSGPPALPHGALVSVGCPRSESCERSWERARCGCT